ncbi:MAG: zinc-binding dehydrogenase, partial [Cyanobacteria bacterium J06649_4]
AGFVWEFMFTRAMYETEDMVGQRELLDAIAQLIDQQVIKTTCKEIIPFINAKNLRQVHAKLEAGHSIGKTVLSGWK